MNKAKITLNYSIVLSFIFLLFHFLIFRSSEINNSYLFYSTNITCYFYYVIPSLLNLILIMLLNLQPNLIEIDLHNKEFQYGGLLLFIYLAIFSNLFCSYIVAVWAGVRILFSVKENRNKKEDWKKIIQKNGTLFIIIICWLISMGYELNGGRAKSLTEGISYSERLTVVVRLFLDTLRSVNILFTTICCVTLFGIILSFIVDSCVRDSIKKNALIVVCNIILACIYLVLLSAMSSPDYIQRPDAWLGIMFWPFYGICLFWGYCIRKKYKIIYFIPIVICIIFFEINVSNRTFKDSNTGNLDWKTAYKVDNYIVDEIIGADVAGKTEIELHVPKSSDEGNWPFALYGGDYISNTLYKHGIVSRKISVVMVPDENINSIYNIDQNNVDRNE